MDRIATSTTVELSLLIFANMKKLLYLIIFISPLVQGQKLLKQDKKMIESLKSHITYLADDKLEGRRAGSEGERLAQEYIVSQFKKADIKAGGPLGSYLQPFDIPDGKRVSPEGYLKIGEIKIPLNGEVFPLSFSGNGSVLSSASMSLRENGEVWFWNVGEVILRNKNNPHFDLKQALSEESALAQKKGASAFIIYNTSSNIDSIRFDPFDKSTPLKIPVLYVSKDVMKKYLNDSISTYDFAINVSIEKHKRTGNNVIAVIDNKASHTVVIGAHYDHLGYGEDHNSLYSGKEIMIHNGADDNASGTAALIELAKLLKKSGLKNNNYLFIAFSGEELGLFGSKYFTEHPTIDLSSVNYMINMDMLGRLNDSTRGLTIGGYGTSPMWSQLLKRNSSYFKIKIDSSGVGPSDHTSFYRKDIPVLFFFTGTHADYHKPSDDEDKINYRGEIEVIRMIHNAIKESDKAGKLSFTKTKEMSMAGKSSFKVSLGIMPDYAFDGGGVRVDGIVDGKIAQKAGIRAGDIIYQLNGYSFTDVMTYMEALNKFNKGDKAKVKVKRGKEELVFDIVF
jgi:aminopeptidase YwaD